MHAMQAPNVQIGNVPNVQIQGREDCKSEFVEHKVVAVPQCT